MGKPAFWTQMLPHQTPLLPTEGTKHTFSQPHAPHSSEGSSVGEGPPSLLTAINGCVHTGHAEQGQGAYPSLQFGIRGWI